MIMRDLAVVFIFFGLNSLIGQKTKDPIFSAKSYPKIEWIDSLSNNVKDLSFLDRLRNLEKEQASPINDKNTMPIFKPEHNSAMPNYDIDTSKTYFLRVFPAAKD
jgi:hypothetical protein